MRKDTLRRNQLISPRIQERSTVKVTQEGVSAHRNGNEDLVKSECKAVIAYNSFVIHTPVIRGYFCILRWLSSYCASRRPVFDFQNPYQKVHNCLLLQHWGSWCYLLALMGTTYMWHTFTYLHVNKNKTIQCMHVKIFVILVTWKIKQKCVSV